MKMTFSEFAKLLYNHIGNRCGADVFTYDLLTNILDPASNTILEELQPDTLRKYYNGRRSIAPLAKRVLPFIEPTCFSAIWNESAVMQRLQISQLIWRNTA